MSELKAVPLSGQGQRHGFIRLRVPDPGANRGGWTIHVPVVSLRRREGRI